MDDLKFKPGYRVEAPQWTCDGEKISTSEKLATIKKGLHESGPILVQHKFLCGARGPHDKLFDDYEEFIESLTEHARAGVWSLWPFMRDAAPLAFGKCPAEDGMVPKGGASEWRSIASRERRVPPPRRGNNKSAQGNALGHRIAIAISPERAAQTRR